MNYKDRLFWFFNNLIALPFLLLCMPIYCIIRMLNGIWTTFMVTDGSSALDPPWKWDKEQWEEFFMVGDWEIRLK